ncbi:MAG: hypothetical protein ACYDA1_01350, partial [Vulcanimicrobiaceae bacterium]
RFASSPLGLVALRGVSLLWGGSIMVTVNFLQVHRSERFFWRVAQGLPLAIVRPIVALVVIGTISLIGSVIQSHELHELDIQVAKLAHTSDRLRVKMLGQRTDLVRLRKLIAIDTAVYQARNTGTRIANMHATLANVIHPQTQLASIVQEDGPTVVTGMAPTYGAIGYSLGKLARTFGSARVGLESARSSSVHSLHGGVTFVLHVEMPSVCCLPAR